MTQIRVKIDRITFGVANASLSLQSMANKGFPRVIPVTQAPQTTFVTTEAQTTFVTTAETQTRRWNSSKYKTSSYGSISKSNRFSNRHSKYYNNIRWNTFILGILASYEKNLDKRLQNRKCLSKIIHRYCCHFLNAWPRIL